MTDKEYFLKSLIFQRLFILEREFLPRLKHVGFLPAFYCKYCRSFPEILSREKAAAT